ncbi:hypothetical protein ACFYOK_04730 [Microbispora bryophytorum]|uniref:hypothetical protein n=1 Tax=Microbispora bryophytorum TaxID=1460882 RepID=UPI0033FBD33B
MTEQPPSGQQHPAGPKKSSVGLILIVIGAVALLMFGGSTAIVAVVGAGADEVVTATPPPAPTPQASQAAPADTGSPETHDPACDMPEVANALYWVEQSFKQGAMDLKGTAQLDRTEAAVWLLVLGRVEDAAELKVYKATVKARDSLNGFLGSSEGSEAAHGWAYSVRVSMARLAQSCDMELAYTFADDIVRRTGGAALARVLSPAGNRYSPSSTRAATKVPAPRRPHPPEATA